MSYFSKKYCLKKYILDKVPFKSSTDFPGYKITTSIIFSALNTNILFIVHKYIYPAKIKIRMCLKTSVICKSQARMFAMESLYVGTMLTSVCARIKHFSMDVSLIFIYIE